MVDGWQLVPKEVTKEMIDAAIRPYRHGNSPEFTAIYERQVAEYYKAMLAAAPSNGSVE